MVQCEFLIGRVAGSEGHYCSMEGAEHKYNGCNWVQFIRWVQLQRRMSCCAVGRVTVDTQRGRYMGATLLWALHRALWPG